MGTRLYRQYLNYQLKWMIEHEYDFEYVFDKIQNIEYEAIHSDDNFEFTEMSREEQWDYIKEVFYKTGFDEMFLPFNEWVDNVYIRENT